MKNMTRGQQMFTGIIEEKGAVAGLEMGAADGKGARIKIRARKILQGTKVGDSIAVNGVCLTATSLGADFFTADVMAETLRRSNLRSLAVGSQVNLERAMAADGRFGGHIVSGHIDGTGTIEKLEREGNDFALVGLHPLAGDDDAVAGAGGVRVVEMVLFRQVHHRQGRVDLAVGLQGGAHPDLRHIGCGDVVGGFGEIPRNGNLIPLHGGIGDLQPAHFLPFERTEGEIGRQGRDPLPVGRGLHEFRLVAGRHDNGRNQKDDALFHG